jgi:hypothetical protein
LPSKDVPSSQPRYIGLGTGHSLVNDLGVPNGKLGAPAPTLSSMVHPFAPITQYSGQRKCFSAIIARHLQYMRSDLCGVILVRAALFGRQDQPFGAGCTAITLNRRTTGDGH